MRNISKQCARITSATKRCLFKASAIRLFSRTKYSQISVGQIALCASNPLDLKLQVKYTSTSRTKYSQISVGCCAKPLDLKRIRSSILCVKGKCSVIKYTAIILNTGMKNLILCTMNCWYSRNSTARLKIARKNDENCRTKIENALHFPVYNSRHICL